MEERIQKPKVFISYAWGDDEYNESVISFATKLKNDGINVIFDRWHLKEGQDMYAFMEKSVTDPNVTNILILIDPTYASKADSRNGGVGTETQIISPDVYKQVEQTKVLPIIFKRGVDGKISKPRFLNSRLHFDLTNEDSYNSEYQRLIKRLYGIDAIKEPELGAAPSWLTEDSSSDRKTFDNLKELVIAFVDESNISTESDISFFSDENRITRILQLSSEIKANIDKTNPLSSDLEKLIDSRVNNYILCRETCLCIRDCGTELGNHTMNSEVISNLHFLYFFSKYAEEQGYSIEINDYLGNEGKTIDAFIEVMKTSEGTDAFLDCLFYTPDKIILNMQSEKTKIIDLLNNF